MLLVPTVAAVAESICEYPGSLSAAALWTSSLSHCLSYDQSKSTTAQDFSTANSVSLLGQPASAAVIKEDCQLRTAGGSGWDYPNQTSEWLDFLRRYHTALTDNFAVVVVNQPAQGQLAQASNAQVGNALAGLIGLATNKNPSSSTNSSEYQPQFGDSIGGQWLNNHPTAVNFTFGMALGTPLLRARGNTSTSKTLDTSAGDPGTLHWLQPDDSAYDPAQVQWKEAGTLAGATSSNTTGDWYVSLDGWVLVSGDNHISNSKSVVATVDPMFTDMYLPQDQAKLIRTPIAHHRCIGAANSVLQMMPFPAPRSGRTSRPWAGSHRPGRFPAMRRSATASSSVAKPSR